MKVLNSGKNLNDRHTASLVATAIAEKNVLIVPVDGIYCLICKGNDETAAKRMYDIKRVRPVQLLASELDDFDRANIKLSRNARKIASAICPAPLTVVDKEEDGTGIVFKIPDEGSFIRLVLDCGSGVIGLYPLAKTPTDVKSLLPSFLREPDAVVDFGFLEREPKVSTVIELSGKSFKVLRPGVVPESKIREAIK